MLAILLLTAPAIFAGEMLLLQGQITEGESLFPPADPARNVPWNEYALPAGGYPVDYTAKLTLGPGSQDWDFEFTVIDSDLTFSYATRGPAVAISRNDQPLNNVESLPESLSIQFNNLNVFYETFTLNLNRATEKGDWAWRLDCPVCDLLYPLPSARATIDSIQIVPEPTSVSLLIGASLLFLFCTARRA